MQLSTVFQLCIEISWEHFQCIIEPDTDASVVIISPRNPQLRGEELLLLVLKYLVCPYFGLNSGLPLPRRTHSYHYTTETGTGIQHEAKSDSDSYLSARDVYDIIKVYYWHGVVFMIAE